MDRGLIIILSVAFIVIWMLRERFLGRGKSRDSQATEITSRVETWFGIAHEQVALMDKTVRVDREGKWNALTKSERVEMTDQFLIRHLGERARTLYRTDEKLRIGAAWYVGTDHDESG